MLVDYRWKFPHGVLICNQHEVDTAMNAIALVQMMPGLSLSLKVQNMLQLVGS